MTLYSRLLHYTSCLPYTEYKQENTRLRNQTDIFYTYLQNPSNIIKTLVLFYGLELLHVNARKGGLFTQYCSFKKKLKNRIMLHNNLPREISILVLFLKIKYFLFKDISVMMINYIQVLMYCRSLQKLLVSKNSVPFIMDRRSLFVLITQIKIFVKLFNNLKYANIK